MHTVEMAALVASDVDEAEVFGSGPVAPKLALWQTASLVAAGGAAGSVLRWAVSLISPVTTTPTLVAIPWATFTVNALGCIALGALTGMLEARPTRRAWVRPLLATGACGGFTTMSTLILEGSALVGGGFPLLAVQYAMLTLIGSLGAVIVGLLTGRKLWEAISAVEHMRERSGRT